MLLDLKVVIKNNISEIDRLMRDVDDFLSRHGIGLEVQSKVMLALEEMLTNTIKYSYDDNAVHDLHVNLVVADEHVGITLEDDGHEFNPLLAKDPDVKLPLEARAIGGLGIYLVKQMVSKIIYNRCDGKNILHMKVNR